MKYVTSQFSRRRFAGLTVAVAAGIAGCLGTISDEESPTITPPDGLIDGTTVLYPGDIADAEVSEDDAVIVYDNPPVQFELQTYRETEPSADDTVRVTRELAGDVPAAWIAPVHAEGDEFTYHVVANEAFVDVGDYTFIQYNLDVREEVRPASWSSVGDVYHDAVRLESDLPLAVIEDQAVDDIDADIEVGGVAITEARDVTR